MKCQKCNKEFPEEEIELSHDVPCYLFFGNRKTSKNKADRFGRHNLCGECHKTYETRINHRLILEAINFSARYFDG